MCAARSLREQKFLNLRRALIRPEPILQDGTGNLSKGSQHNEKRRKLHSPEPDFLTSLTRCDFRQCSSQFIWFEAKWPRLGLEGDATICINQINSVWPAGIGSLGRISELIKH